MSLRSWKSDAVRVVLSLALFSGVGVGVYLAWHHENHLFGDATAKLANCPENDTINCDLVNTSPWSELLGVPIAAFAIPTYLLLVILVWGSRTRPSMLSYVFSIGLLTAIVSALLFYISKTQIGFLCLWCLRLYAVNVSIPILAAVAAWRSPLALVRETFADLLGWPRTLRFTATAFLILLALTVAAQKGYRAELKRRTADEIRRIMSEGGPTIPAVPEPAGASPSPDLAPADRDPDPPAPGAAPPRSEDRPESTGSRLLEPVTPRLALASMIPLPLAAILGAPAESSASGADRAAPPSPAATPPPGQGAPPSARPAPPSPQPVAPSPQLVPSPSPPAGAAPPGGAYVLAGPLRRLSGGKDLKSEKFDLQSRLGAGKPVALIFWAPGFRLSERALADWSVFLKQNAPGFEVYAVSGRGETERDEQIWEDFAMMNLPSDLPLLVDDRFKVSTALDVLDVPNLTLFDAKGNLVIAKIKHREQLLVAPSGNAPAEEIVRKVGAGEAVPTIKRMFPYYPASELYGRCAPSFTLKKFNANDTMTFSGRSSSGRPTMLIFWSSTCRHCQVEIPQLVAWVKTHPNTVEIISVTHIKAEAPNEPSHRKVTEAYIKSQGISWPVLEDPDRAVEDLYESISTPTSYFISPNGTVVDAWFYAHEEGFELAMTRELARASREQACRSIDTGAAPVMSFSLAGPDGKRANLASLTGKPTIVHFWATWCKPCIEELPSLVRFRDRLEKSGEGRVLFVSVEDEGAGPQILKFQKAHGLDLRSYRAPSGGLADRLEMSYRVPRSFFVGPGGVILGSRQGGQDWDDPAVAGRALSRLANPGPAPDK